MGVILIAFLAGYLLGSIPTAVWVGRMFFKVDIRTLGSGNAGASNVYRSFGWKPGLAVLIVDLLKGAVATLFPDWMGWTDYHLDAFTVQIVAGSAAVVGHCWPVFAGFRGGKGVATAAGILLALSTLTFFGCILVYAFVLKRTRYSSLASVFASVCLPVLLYLQEFLKPSRPDAWLYFGGLIAMFVLFTHRANLKRLFAGTEHRTE